MIVSKTHDKEIPRVPTQLRYSQTLHHANQFVPMRFFQCRSQGWLSLSLALLVNLALPGATRADQAIFTDSLQNGWQDWSWATHDVNNASPTHSGSKSISVTAGAWSAISFWHSAQPTSAFTSFSFWIHGGSSGGQSLQIYAEKDGVSLPGVVVPTAAAGTWQQVTLSLDSLGLAGATNLTRFNIFNASGNSLPTFYLDDISLISDITPPVVQSISPAAGMVAVLTNIIVTFSETVTGINASDLRVNGNPALSMSGSGATYSFTFAQPPEGLVNVTWAAGHGITDLSSPANAFNAAGPGATWQYTMLDSIAPVMSGLFPSGGAIVVALSQIEVTFSETVLNVQAADLLINGSPATNVTKLSGQPYVFKFPPPPTGNVSVAWAPGHGITDGAAGPNPFAGGAWSYTLNPNLTQPDLVINEFLAANVTTNGLTDEDGAQEDWIELYNRGTQPVNLADWSLSDDPALPGLWTFPARTLNPGQYLVVFASGKDRRPTSTSSNLHTNFKLANGGEPLGLYSSDSPRQLVSGFTPFPEQRNDVSYGLDLAGALRYFATPTPGAANGLSTIIGVVEPVHVNVNRGHFTTPFTLTASCPTPGAGLRYTTDGSEPTTSSAMFPGSLQISNTTLFRIAAFKANHLPAQCVTHSYLFNLPEAFRSLPVVSIVTGSNNLWGPTGIMGFGPGYRNVEQHGLAWEKPISLEWIQPTDDSGFQVDCGIRIQGSDYNRDNSNADSKFSFRLYFRSDYGPGRLNYPVFANTSVESFDGLVLRAGFNEQENPFIRDELHRRLSADMGQLAAHGNMAIVLLNGNYYTNSAAPWILPVYNPTERVHAEFFQEHLGGSELWDVVKPPWQEGGGAVDGTFTDMANLVNYVDNVANVTQPADYNTISAWLDLTNFVDYLVLNTYAGMGDWPNNNWRAGRDQAGGPWRFVFWDAEWGMGIYGRSPTGINSFTDALNDSAEISRLYRSLRDSAEFRLLWADRVQKHFFNGGALMGASITNRFRELETELAPIIPSMNPEILNWVANRWPTYLSQMNSEGLQSSVVAPSFNQNGGRVAPGFNLTITAPAGTIYYTTNGTDPRVPFTGAVSASALTYSGGVTLNNTVGIRARARNGSTWSAINEATFTVGTLGIPLRITEIMYNPSGGSLYEFLELQNTSGVAVNLGGLYFDGINFIFPEGTSLAGGARLVLGANTDTNAWKALYAGVNPSGWFGGSLNNAGERLSLFDKFGNLITSVDYADNAGWPKEADGNGRSLEIINPTGDPDAPANWKASAANNGTPGAANSAAPAQPVYLNELMAENTSAVNHGGTFPDWIELRNPTATNVTITGWSLTDDGNARKFVFPATTITAGGYLTVWCDATTNTTPGLHTGFSLDKDGETISLYDANTNRIDALTCGLQLANYSVGRIGGSWGLTTPTTNAANISATLAAASNLALNEWLANPAPGLPDWIEIYNKSAVAPVALQGVYLVTSNTTHQITSLSFLAPLGYVQLFADEGVGADHLDLKLSASGETLTLADNTGGTIQTISFGTQAEGVSQGRWPNGTGSITNFVGTASPEAANYLATWTGPIINEVLARNRSVTVGTQIVDYVELFNPSGSVFNLSGLSLSVNSLQAGEFIFPPGATIAANSYLTLKCDGASPVVTNLGAFNVGESLDGESGGVYLFNTNNQVVSSVEYGPQVDDLPIGRSSGQWRLLSSATPGAVNAAAAILGTNSALRLNEWMPKPAKGDDWFELFNTTNRPVDLATISLTDDPSLAGRGKFRPAALSFIGANGFVKWNAANAAGDGRNHVNFALDDAGESLLLYGVVNNTNFTLVDTLGFGVQTNGVSSGRFRDGAANVLAFPNTASPGFSNYRPLQSVVINEALAHTDPPLEDAIELYNPTASPVSINGWFLSNSKDNLRRYQITNTAPIPAGGFTVIYEYQFNNGTTNAFTLKAAYDDEIWLTAITNSVETGERATVAFGASINGVSFGRVPTSQGVDFWPLTARKFGVDNPTTLAQFRTGPGLSNAAPVIGPIIINEIMFHPPGGTNSTEEYVELRNNTASPAVLYDPAYPTNRWKLGGGIEFTFPASVSLAANAHLLVVDFNPTNNATLTAFRNRYGISASVPVYGPFGGALDNAAESVELYRPDSPQLPPAADAGFVPYVIVDRVSYTDTAPWPGGAVDGGGLSLQRLAVNLYGNEPLNWGAASPTPGTGNATSSPDTDGDGIPDAAEDSMGLDYLNPLDAGVDNDLDGLTNLQEYLAGTNHEDTNSNLKFTQISVGSNVTLTFPAVADKTYSVLYQNSLAETGWTKLTDVSASATNGLQSVTDSLGGAATRFYRLVTPALNP
jgi:hypothetical protein